MKKTNPPPKGGGAMSEIEKSKWWNIILKWGAVLILVAVIVTPWLV
jgi:hypothetical protein